MPLRIAIDGRVALHTRTGFGTICHAVLRRIATIDPDNQYFFYFDRDPGDRLSTYPAHGYAFGGSQEELVWCHTFLREQVKRDHIDVYVTFLDKEIPFLPLSLKVISMVHDLARITFPEPDSFRSVVHKLYYNTLIRASVRRSNLVLTNSEFSRSEIIETLHVRPQKVRKITLGVAERPTLSEDAKQQIRSEYGVHGRYIFALGSATPNKNNISVIHAFRKVQNRFPDLSLVIGGKNWLGKSFPPELMDERIRLTGFIEDDHLPALMEGAELFAFPSLHEGFGLPVIEAMSCGVPVITSNVTALPEVAGDAALCVSPHSVEEISAAMERVLSDPLLAQQMAQRGLVRAEKFRWETACKEIADACRELAKGAR